LRRSPTVADANKPLFAPGHTLALITRVLFGSISNKSELNSRRNDEHIKFGECLLALSSESFVFSLLPKNLNIKIYKTIIAPVVLYGCVRWRLFGKNVLRRMFGPKREEVAGGWRRLHNEELHNL
jgi:hypothetical protein